MAMSSSASTATPDRARDPVAGSVVISTEVISSPTSTSVYPQSLAVVVNV